MQISLAEDYSRGAALQPRTILGWRLICFDVCFDACYLPDVARVSADQLDDFAGVADGAVGEQEEQAGVAPDYRLPQDPAEGIQDVGPAHVGSDLPDILARQGQSLLMCGDERDAASISVWGHGPRGRWRWRFYLLVVLAGGEERFIGGAEANDVKKATWHEALQHHHHGVLRGEMDSCSCSKLRLQNDL